MSGGLRAGAKQRGDVRNAWRWGDDRQKNLSYSRRDMGVVIVEVVWFTKLGSWGLVMRFKVATKEGLGNIFYKEFIIKKKTSNLLIN